jgi:hypothetical protein
MVLASVSASLFIQTARSQIIVHCPNGLQQHHLFTKLQEGPVHYFLEPSTLVIL